MLKAPCGRTHSGLSMCPHDQAASFMSLLPRAVSPYSRNRNIGALDADGSDSRETCGLLFSVMKIFRELSASTWQNASYGQSHNFYFYIFYLASHITMHANYKSMQYAIMTSLRLHQSSKAKQNESQPQNQQNIYKRKLTESRCNSKPIVLIKSELEEIYYILLVV